VLLLLWHQQEQSHVDSPMIQQHQRQFAGYSREFEHLQIKLYIVFG
jgi:hypothetical protein